MSEMGAMWVAIGHDAIGWADNELSKGGEWKSWQTENRTHRYAHLRTTGGEKEREDCYAQFEDVSLYDHCNQRHNTLGKHEIAEKTVESS